MRKPNSIIVLLYIFHIIHPQKQKRSVQPFCFWEEHSKGLSNQADVKLDMINKCNICSRYYIYHVKFTSYCELIECSRPIRFFIVSLMYNNNSYCVQYTKRWAKSHFQQISQVCFPRMLQSSELSATLIGWWNLKAFNPKKQPVEKKKQAKQWHTKYQ